MEKKRESIIKEAITDYKAITEAAEKNAEKKLAKEFPDKFNSLLKEELEKNKNNKKESYKKIDEKKESKDTLDESESKKDNTVMAEEKKEAKTEAKRKMNEEREKDFMGDVENDTPNKGKSDSEDGVAFKENPKKGKDMKETTNEEKEDESKDDVSEEKKDLKEDFDISDLEIGDIDNALDAAEPDDEIVTMEEIEREIAEMEELKNEMNSVDEAGVDSNLSPLKHKLQEMMDEIDKMQEMHQGNFDLDKMHKGQYDDKLIDEKDDDMYEQKQQGGKQNYKGRENGGPTNSMIDEEEVDEAMGMAHSSSKHVAGDHLPGEDFAKHRHKRSGSFNNPQNENVNKRLTSLMNENKKLTKKLNESKKYKATVDNLVENYKTVLGKYRNQLKEMAIFNTNLSHVNNLLVNEALALTQDDKVKIIKEFKEVNTINESKKKYDSILSEMKTEKKNNISESVESKLSNSVQSSSKKSIDEVVEKTAYENDEHIKRIKKLNEYIDNRGKNKKVL